MPPTVLLDRTQARKALDANLRGPGGSVTAGTTWVVSQLRALGAVSECNLATELETRGIRVDKRSLTLHGPQWRTIHMPGYQYTFSRWADVTKMSQKELDKAMPELERVIRSETVGFGLVDARVNKEKELLLTLGEEKAPGGFWLQTE